jgi:hypothetical protein
LDRTWGRIEEKEGSILVEGADGLMSAGFLTLLIINERLDPERTAMAIGGGITVFRLEPEAVRIPA